MQLDDLNYVEQGDIAIVSFDAKNQKVNTLNSRLLPQFELVFQKIEVSPHIVAIVIISSKKDSFIAGADIRELQQAETEEEVKQLSIQGQEFLNRLEELNKPVIAAVHGSCLGGGFELALACDYIVATQSPKTVFGLPEVMLGLLPGAGGTQRLRRVVGLEKALQLTLTGMSIRTNKAKAFGIVDYVTTPKALRCVAIQAASLFASKKIAKKPYKSNLKPTTLLSKIKMGRDVIFNKSRKMIQSKTKGLYPAPSAIIDVIEYGYDYGQEQGFTKEANEFARLSQTSESKSLISLYFGQTELKKNRFQMPAAHKVNKIGVLGSGLMGSGIGLVSIQKELPVLLKDVTYDALGKSQKYIWQDLNKKVKRKSLSLFDAKKMMGHITSCVNYDLFKTCDLVVEAVFEELELKHKVLQEVEAHLPERAVFASNTSAIPIEHIAKVSKRPENVIGMHYFSPVQKMPLLEIITTEKTSSETAALAVDVGLRQGKTVIVVKDGPGFYTTRILAPFMDEVAQLCLEHVPFLRLDRVMQAFGYPVGPITLIDEVGIDVALHVGETLGEAFGKRVSSSDPHILQALVHEKHLGKKTGSGFYSYQKPSLWKKIKGKKPRKQPNLMTTALVEKYGKNRGTISDQEIQERLAYRMINEATYCLEEGILSQAVDGDIGAVFGLGFPPFLGGPFRFCDIKGVQSVVDTLNKYKDKFGDRFAPSQLLLDMAKANKTFYS